MNGFRAGRLFITVVGAVAVAACGGDGAPRERDAIDLRKEQDVAFNALESHFNHLIDGQSSKAYADLHPAQRALFTAEQYGKCISEAAELDKLEARLMAANVESDKLIPGTMLKADALALTVELDVGNDPNTNTYHLWKVDGKWFFAVDDPEDVIDGTC